MSEKIKITDFMDDKEKMRDFKKLTREEFLNTYSYLHEEEYDLTLQAEALAEFCEWYRLPYPTTQKEADEVFSELDSAKATENVMEDGEISEEEGERKYQNYLRIASHLLKKFKVRPLKHHYDGTFEHFDVEKQKIKKW